MEKQDFILYWNIGLVIKEIKVVFYILKDLSFEITMTNVSCVIKGFHSSYSLP